MNLAWTLKRQGMYQEAEATNRQALAIQQQVLGHEHPHTLISVINLGSGLLKLGQYEESEALFRQALVSSQKVHGLEHPDTLTCASSLALALQDQARKKESEEMYRELLAIKENVLGRDHPDTLISAHNLASTLASQGMLKEAEVIYRRTLATKEDMLGHEHPSTLASVTSLAHLLADRGCYGESLALFDKACVGCAKDIGEDHPDTRRCYKNRSVIASRDQSESIAIRERNLSSVRYLADQYATQRLFDASTALYDKAYAEFHKVLGEDHPITRECYEDRSRLASWLQARTSAEAGASSTPFDEELVASEETSSTVSPATEAEDGLRAPPVEKAANLQKRTATDRSSPKKDHNGSAPNGQVSRIPRWSGKPENQSLRRKIKLQSSVTSLQQKNMSFRDTQAR
jgi:tetratricopeptide (TPR) repeat protein